MRLWTIATTSLFLACVTPAAAAPVHRGPVHRGPVHRAPADHAPAHHTTIHHAPVHRAPVHRAPDARFEIQAPATTLAEPEAPAAPSMQNGPAYWGGAPTGPDFVGVVRRRFQPSQPDPTAQAATVRQRARFQDVCELPENIQVSYDGMTEGASRPVTDFSEVHLAVSPLDPDHLLASSKFFHNPARYGFYTGVFESFDGGQRWSQMQPPGIEAYSLTSDPVNTFDHLGTGYFTLLTRGPTGLDMIGKPRGGEWQTPVVVDRSTTTDKQWIAGDMDLDETSPYAGRLYMSWTDVGNPARIVFSHSSDGNQNWSAPPLELDRGSLQGSIVAVGPEGTVHVVYGDQIFGSAAPGQLTWVKSTDGGESFSAPAKVASTVSIPFQLPNSVFRAPASLPAFAVSPTDGYLYATWADYATGDADILLARSTDGGESWDPPVRMNDDPLSNGVDQFQPQVSVAVDGRVAVAWLDRRMDCPALPWIPESHVGRSNFCIDTFMTRSYDAGASWVPNIRATAQTWDPAINLPMVDTNTGFIGDYIGMASTLDYDYALFPSTADLGANPRNRQQVFVARIPARAPRQNLVASRLRLDPPAAAAGDTVAVIVDVVNCGPEDARAAGLDLALPESLAYVDGSLSAEAGQARYDAPTRSIHWQGPVPAGASVQLRFEGRLDSALEEGARIRLEAHFRDDEDRAYLRVASLAVSIKAVEHSGIYLPWLARGAERP